MTNIENCIKLSNGHYFNLINPNPDHITIDVIANALSKICRFSGQCSKFYSVAEHSVHCYEEGDEWDYEQNDLKALLMHDAAEAFIGDMSTVLKRMMPEYKKIETNLLKIIGIKYSIDWSIHNRMVKDIDMDMLIHEKRQLFDKDNIPWTGEEITFDINNIVLHFWSPEIACAEFIKCATKLGLV